MTVTPASFGEPLFDKWVRLALFTPSAAFAPIDGKGGNLARRLAESRAMASNFLKPAFDPFRINGVHWLARAADAGGADLLRADFQASNMPAQVTTGQNFLLLRVTPPWPLAGDAATATRLADLIGAAVNTDTADHTWRFDVPPRDYPPDTPVLITSRDAPNVASVEDFNARADVLVYGGNVHFVFYRKIHQTLGWPADDQWFDGDARTDLAPPRGGP